MRPQKARSILAFIEHLLDKRLSAKTINCYLDGIRGFYDYLIHEEGVEIVNPVKRRYVLKLSRPLPRYLRDEGDPAAVCRNRSHARSIEKEGRVESWFLRR